MLPTPDEIRARPDVPPQPQPQPFSTRPPQAPLALPQGGVSGPPAAPSPSTVPSAAAPTPAASQPPALLTSPSQAPGSAFPAPRRRLPTPDEIRMRASQPGGVPPGAARRVGPPPPALPVAPPTAAAAGGGPPQGPVATAATPPYADPAKEAAFQAAYRQYAQRWGIDPNPDNPEHHYDYRRAMEAGAAPDPVTGHWPSEFKTAGHPNRYVEGVDTITGQPEQPFLAQGPAGPQTREQAIRRLRLHQQAQAPTTRLEPTVANELRGLGTGVQKGLYTMWRNYQAATQPPSSPGVLASNAVAPIAQEEYFQPYEEAAPGAMQAGEMFAQQPLFEGAGAAAKAVEPATKLGQYGLNAILDALAIQPTMDPNTPLGERAKQTAIAPAIGAVTRLPGDVIEAVGRRRVPLPTPDEVASRVNLERETADLPVAGEGRLSPQSMAAKTEAVERDTLKRRAADQVDALTALPHDEAAQFKARLRAEGVSQEARQAILAEAHDANAAWERVGGGREIAAPPERVRPPEEHAAGEAAWQDFQTAAAKRRAKGPETALSPEAARAAEMSARLPDEARIPGNIGPQGEMGGRVVYNEPSGSTKAAAPEPSPYDTQPLRAGEAEAAATAPGPYDTQPIRPVAEPPRSVEQSAADRYAGERGSAPLGLAAPGAAPIEAAARKVEDVAAARHVPSPTAASDVGLSKYFLTPQHNIERFRKVAPEAADAMADIRATDERMHRAIQAKLADWQEPVQRLPRRGREKAYAAIVDVIEGRQPKTAPTPEQAAVAAHLKPRFEATRREFVTDAHARGLDVPDTWGVSDYFPHVFRGEYRIFARDPVTGARNLVGSATSKLDAMGEIRHLAKEQPGLTPDAFSVETTRAVAPDITRVSSPNKWRMINEIADEAGVSREDVANAMRGVIGAKEHRAKWFGNVLKRRGAGGYSRDIPAVLEHYISGMTRHMELSGLNRRVQPLLRDLRNRGLGNLADEVQSNLDQLWGVRSESAKALDATLAKMPGVNLVHRTGAMERWTGRTRGLLATLQLATPKFHLVLQPLQLAQTLYPVVGESGMLRALKLYVSKEGRAILDRHGVKVGVSRWTERAPMLQRIASKVSSPRTKAALLRLQEMASSETRNQEVAFLAMYDKAKRLGMRDAEAAAYARERGQFATQFYPSVADMPKAARGPVGKTIFQYRRFQVKNLELAMSMLRERNYPGAARWLGVNLLLGGAKTVLKYGPLVGAVGLAIPGETGRRLRQAPAYLTLTAYNALKRDYGDTLADLVMYGLPGLVGLDLSNSVQVLDVPFGDSLPEIIGNAVMGPTGQLAASTIKAAQAAPGPEPSAAKRVGRSLAQRLPAVRMVDALRRVYQRDYDFTTADGRLRYKGDMTEVLKQAGAFRSTDRGDEELWLNGLTEVEARRSEAINEAAAEALRGDVDAARAIVLRHNALWPEFPITGKDMDRRMGAKRQMQSVPLTERLLRQAPKAVQRGMPQPPR